MTDAELHAQIQDLAEQLAEYQAVVGDAVQAFGHTGNQPVDLRDAIGQLERLIAGHDLESRDLQGLAEDVRDALWHRDRAVSLLHATRLQCERRTAERDIALAQLTR